MKIALTQGFSRIIGMLEILLADDQEVGVQTAGTLPMATLD
ncbi:MAG: hypothetical protein ACREM1_18730 [Longimicrobiales bacterium]